MTTTREQALENALRELLRCSAIPETWAAPARAALALPPDGVNADMLAALQRVAKKIDDASGSPSFTEREHEKLVVLIARATASPQGADKE